MRERGFATTVFTILLPVLCCAIVAADQCAAAGSVSESWVRRYGLSVFDNAKAIAVDTAGNSYVTGYSTGASGDYDYVTIKYDPAGNRKWMKRYNGPGKGWDAACAIAVDKSGNVYVTGESKNTAGDFDFATIKYNSSGAVKWVKRYDSPTHLGDRPCGLALGSSGSVYVAGTSGMDTNSEEIAIIKYDSDGNLKWVKRTKGEARAMALDKAENVHVAGKIRKANISYEDFLVVKYDRDGIQKWSKVYSASGWSDVPNAIAVDRFGNVFVTGHADNAPNTSGDCMTVKYDLNGKKKWSKRYDGSFHGDDNCYAIATDTSGNAYITGYSYGFGSYQDFLTLKYNPDGSVAWERHESGPLTSWDIGYAIALDRSRNVYATGVSDRGYYTVKYDSAGSLQWSIPYLGLGTGVDEAHGIAVDTSGNVFVTGYSTGSDGTMDFATIKYQQQ
jgi:uncharacterized delta-60 repeat protein